MTQIHRAFKILASITCAALAVSCATDDLKDQKNLAAAAGFKVITPVKPDQVALLPTLPKDHVTKISYHGKTYYILPDAENHKAYVGGPAEYQTYDQLRLQKQLNDAENQAEQLDHMETLNQMNWGAWGGWGGYGWSGMGAPIGPRVYRR